MKITVDTNVLVSATFWHGDSEKIITKAENKEIELILSKDIIQEYTDVLQYKEMQDKIKDKNLNFRRPVEKIIAIATIVQPMCKIHVVKDDPDDNIILECAKEGKVDYILSKDNHLLKLKEFEGIPIIKPEEFIKIIK